MQRKAAKLKLHIVSRRLQTPDHLVVSLVFIDMKKNAEYQPTYTLKENLSLQYFSSC